MVLVDIGSLEDLCGRKIGQSRSAIPGSSLGALQKWIHEKLSWSSQERRVVEETFTDRLLLLVRYVEDSLKFLFSKQSGLLAFTALLLMPALKSNAGRHSASTPPPVPHQVKLYLCPRRGFRRGTPTGMPSNHRRRRSCQIPLLKSALPHHRLSYLS